MRKVAENLIFQVIFQVSKIIIPIITVPIVSKALGPYGIGVYNYTNSIVQYVIIIAGLGITLYGNREIAQSKDDIVKRSQIFIDLVFLKLLVTLICYIVFFLCILNSKYFLYFLVQSFVIFSVIFDVSWFFMGLEEFKKISLINLFFQLISLVLIVFFVNNSSDLLSYILIQSATIFLGQATAWIYLKEKIKIQYPNFHRIKRHFISSLPYFIPQVAVLLYTNVNKTLLGIFGDTVDVAYYSNAQTINSIIITLITSLDIVLLPKMSYLSKKNNQKKMIDIMSISIQSQLLISIPCFFGIIAITPQFVPWFFGKSFLFLNNLIPMMACLVIIVPLGMAISRQYLLPKGEIKQYNKTVITGAIINILINLTFIGKIGVYAAVISTICAEIVVTLTRYINFYKRENFRINRVDILKMIVSAMVMFIGIKYMTDYYNLRASFFTTLIQVTVGFSIYIVMLLVLKVKFIKVIKGSVIK